MTDLSHVDEKGRAAMVDVTAKAETERAATAEATIRLSPATCKLIADGAVAKGDVMAAARIAGIMAAKKTHELIPLCHPLMLTGVAIDVATVDGGLRIEATVKTKGQTGVEMEALTAATVAALTIYDMIKAVEREATIEGVRLTRKTGGKSEEFVRGEPSAAPGSGKPEPAKPALVSRGFQRSPRAGVRPRAMASIDDPKGPATSAEAAISRLDHFRRFLRDNRMQVTRWAADAGLPVGLVYGFLHGRVGRLPRDSEERLARAAATTVRDLFGSE